jgi:hypothetical protein
MQRRREGGEEWEGVGRSRASQHLGRGQGSRRTSGRSKEVGAPRAGAGRRTSGPEQGVAPRAGAGHRRRQQIPPRAPDGEAEQRRLADGRDGAGRRRWRPRLWGPDERIRRTGGRGGARTARRRERRSKDCAPASAEEAATGGARTGGGANPSSARARARSGQGEHAAGREKKEIRNEPLPYNQWHGG